MKITYNVNVMKYMAYFDSITKAPLKDCFELNEVLYFIVQEGSIGKAIGNQSKNILRLKQKLQRKLRIVEFNSKLDDFVKNLVYPIKIDIISDDDKILTIQTSDHKGRGLLIGRNAQNLRTTEAIIKRYFSIDELKVA